MSTLHASLVAYALHVCGATSVDVGWLGVDPSALAAGDYHWSGDPCRTRPRLGLTVVSRQQAVQRVSVQPQLTLWVPALVAAQRVDKGGSVHAVPGQVALSSLRGEKVYDADADWVARVSLQAGDPLTVATVRSALDAQAGASVAVRVHASGLTVESPGRLLRGATLGSPCRVQILATHAVRSGVLIAPDTVEVTP